MGSAVVLQFPCGGEVADRGLELITKAAAAAYLGVGERTLDRLRKHAALPMYEIAGRVYFRRAELDAWRIRRT